MITILLKIHACHGRFRSVCSANRQQAHSFEDASFSPDLPTI
jgi:hypothetical protein